MAPFGSMIPMRMSGFSPYFDRPELGFADLTPAPQYPDIYRLPDSELPAKRRYTALREYVEAMRALWTEDIASYDGEFVSFGGSWAYPNRCRRTSPSWSGQAARTDLQPARGERGRLAHHPVRV